MGLREGEVARARRSVLQNGQGRPAPWEPPGLRGSPGFAAIREPGAGEPPAGEPPAGEPPAGEPPTGGPGGGEAGDGRSARARACTARSLGEAASRLTR